MHEQQWSFTVAAMNMSQNVVGVGAYLSNEIARSENKRIIARESDAVPFKRFL